MGALDAQGEPLEWIRRIPLYLMMRGQKFSLEALVALLCTKQLLPKHRSWIEGSKEKGPTISRRA